MYLLIDPKEDDNWPVSVRMHIDGTHLLEGRTFGIHAVTLYESIIRMNSKKVLEIGRRRGFSTRIIIDAVKKTGGHLWSIDPVIDHEFYDFTPKENLEFVTVIKSNHEEWSPIENFDFIFVDTKHLYEETKLCLGKYWSFLKSPGIIFMHKYDSHYGEKKAIHEFVEDRKIACVFDTRDQGIALLTKPLTIWARDRKEPDVISNSQYD